MSFGRDVRGAIFAQVGGFSAREVDQFGAPSLITRNTNDVQQVQMLVVMTCTMLVAAPIMCVGGIIMALRQDVGLSWLPGRRGAGAGARRSASSIRRMIPLLPSDADPNRRREPRAARADLGHPRGPRVRPRAARDGRASARANADLTRTQLRVGR